MVLWKEGVLDFEDPVSGRTKKGAEPAVFKTDERGADPFRRLRVRRALAFADKIIEKHFRLKVCW